MHFADYVLKFQKELHINTVLPPGIHAMNPYQDENAFHLCTQFYQKFYNDINKRTLIIGINPGRFGGGITGVPFTDPIKLEMICGIKNSFVKKAELSADFIYKMIESYGGPEKFYNNFYITAVSPLGFVKDGKNLNYYDVKELQHSISNYIVDCFKKQINFGVNTEICFCLGEGENFKFITKLNQTHNFFKAIIPLPHPRFIMQYRRKRIDEFIRKYITEFEKA